MQCERARARDEGRARAAIAVLSAAAVAAACVVAGAAGGRAARLARGEHAVELLAHAATQKLAQIQSLPVYSETEEVAKILKEMLSDLSTRLSVIDEVRNTWQFYRDRRPDAYDEIFEG